MNNIHQEIAYLLGELGNDMKTVGRNLVMLGCKGARNSSNSCPVAVYLKRHGLADVIVGVFRVHARQDMSDHTSVVGTPLPKPVIEFIREFDIFAYENLVG